MNRILTIIIFLLLTSCRSYKVVVNKEGFKTTVSKSVEYKNWVEAISNMDFDDAKKLSLKSSHRKMIEFHECLIKIDGRAGNQPFIQGEIHFDYLNGVFEYTE